VPGQPHAAAAGDGEGSFAGPAASCGGSATGGVVAAGGIAGPAATGGGSATVDGGAGGGSTGPVASGGGSATGDAARRRNLSWWRVPTKCPCSLTE